MTSNLCNWQQCSTRKPIFSVAVWIILVICLTGCSSNGLQATPTPTKTSLPIPRDGENSSEQSDDRTLVNNSSDEALILNTPSSDTGSFVSASSVSVTAIPSSLAVIAATPTASGSVVSAASTFVDTQSSSSQDNSLQVEPQKEIVLELVDPTPIPGNLAPFTGLPVEDPALLSRRPMIVCINNDAAGRAAHHGLGQADVVYEYIVDGFSMTRISAIYQSKEVDRVGPVRSARLPNIWMTDIYDGALACSGGSDPIRYLLTNEADFPYLDADRDDPNNSRYFSSIGTDYRTRLQASTAGLQKWLTGIDKADNWDRDGFVFDENPALASAGDATVVNIRYPGGGSVEWRYDATVGGYIRYQAGKKQIDLGTGQPVIATNIMAVVATHTETDIVEDSLGTRSVDIQLYGTGDLRLFRDGVVYEGVWHAYADNPPRWLDLNAQVIPLKPGASWIQVIRNLSEVSHQ